MAMWAVLALCLVPTCLADITLVPRAFLKFPDHLGQLKMDNGAAKESDYDPLNRFLYVVGSTAGIIHVVNLANIDSPTIQYTSVFNISTHGSPLDVQVCRSGVRNLFAISFGEGDPVHNGHVVFYELFSGVVQSLQPMWGGAMWSVGANPDNIKFTSNCAKLVVSNEGLPAVIAGEYIDPPGTINVLDIPETEASNVVIHTLGFEDYDVPAEQM